MSVVFKNYFVPLHCQNDKVTSFINNLTTTAIMKNEIILSVLEDLRNELFELSDTFISCDQNSPYFDDSCKVVNARHKLLRLYDALKLASEYAKD